MIDKEAKARENRLRRRAENRGLRLIKARRTDPLAPDHNRWMIIDPRGSMPPVGAGNDGRPTMTLEEVRVWLEVGCREGMLGAGGGANSDAARLAKALVHAANLRVHLGDQSPEWTDVLADPVMRQVLASRLATVRQAIDAFLEAVDAFEGQGERHDA